MRIITGIYGGRILFTGNERSLRPTTDRVKETIFNILMNRIELAGRDVLDLYAGSGNLGLEALSRGAERVVFVDQSPRAVRTIHRNIRLLGCEDNCTVLEADVLKFLGTTREGYDVIFADPPYDIQSLNEMITEIFSRRLLREEGIVAVEHRADASIIPDGLFVAEAQREFGETAVTFLRHAPNAENL